MPWTTQQVTLGTAGELIVGADNMPHNVVLHNHTKSSNEYIHIGPDDTVSETNSIHIDPGQTIYLELDPGDEVWAMSDPDGLVVGVADFRMAD
jgi:hypothetical protein